MTDHAPWECARCGAIYAVGDVRRCTHRNGDSLTAPPSPLRQWPAGTVAPVDATDAELDLHLRLYGSVYTESRDADGAS